MPLIFLEAGMQKQHFIAIGTGLALLLGLYFGGSTVATNKKKTAPTEKAGEHSFNIANFEAAIVGQLPAYQKMYVADLQKKWANASNLDEKHTYLHKLSGFWKDSVPNPPIHFFYTGELSKLDNTEKSLTFAAHSILGYLPYEKDHERKHWLANRGKELFDIALSLNQANDSTIIGIAGCIMYGADAGGQDNNPMAGILKVREVAERDSTNIFAQYMLGIGGLISGQFDKAAIRFEKVIAAQPNNMEVMFKLAESYEMSQNNEKAVLWYQNILDKVENPEMRMELNKRISMLKSR